MSETNTHGTRFAPEWESLKQQYQIPRWYEDAKFGIFIHWGVYAVPAFGNEWYPRNMYIPGSPEFEHHVATYGAQDTFGYKDFIPQFTAASFDAAAWAKLFREAGARYVVPVAEHHDGFPLYDSAFTEWNAAKMGPQRDLIGEIAQAVRAEGMVFGVSYHRVENWFFFNGGRTFPSDVQDERYRGLYGPAQPQEDMHAVDAAGGADATFLEEWLQRACELVDLHRPQIFWFDWWIQHQSVAPYLPRFAAYYYNQADTWGSDWDQNGAAINYKFDAFPAGTAVFDIERGQLSGLRHPFWQTDTAVAKNSWGYTENNEYKSTGTIVGDLVDIVSKNGSLLLNIGPRPDGTIPDEDQQILREIGRWLAVNGEAIYETRPWHTFGEGPTEVAEGAFSDTKRAPFTSADIRFTTRPDALYAILLGWPEGPATITSLTDDRVGDRSIGTITLLGHDQPLQWRASADGLRVELPSSPPCDHAYTLKIAYAD